MQNWVKFWDNGVRSTFYLQTKHLQTQKCLFHYVWSCFHKSADSFLYHLRFPQCTSCCLGCFYTALTSISRLGLLPLIPGPDKALSVGVDGQHTLVFVLLCLGFTCLFMSIVHDCFICCMRAWWPLQEQLEAECNLAEIITCDFKSMNPNFIRLDAHRK